MIRSLFTSADEKRSTIGGDDDHSRVLVGKMADQGVGPRDDSHGQAVGRFMEDDDAWHLCQASANPHLLPIAARQCHYALTSFRAAEWCCRSSASTKILRPHDREVAGLSLYQRRSV
jgi:hypothetical protein